MIDFGRSTYNSLGASELKYVLDYFEKSVMHSISKWDKSMQTSMHKKIYVASPWFCDKSEILLNTFTRVLRAFSDKSGIKFYFPRSESNANNESPSEVFAKNVEAIKECDALVALISQPDSGTAFEIGFAKANDIPVYLAGTDETDFTCSKMNAMMAYAGTPCTIHSFICELMYGLSSEIEYDKNWEVIE